MQEFYSATEEFHTAITRYFTQEKRPQLFKNLANDLEDVCINVSSTDRKAQKAC
ncbi:hypothetical protein [Nostoc sp.]|uniref:hypothetical protein n=1 Tax=Nostoc sp. TaxID=1180 RepID=UPI002FF82440